MNRSNLKDLMGDTPETEINKTVVEATVTEKLDERRFLIRDDSTEIELEVEDKFKNKLQVGYKFAFYSPEKVSAEKLRLSKASYPKKLFQDESFNVEIKSIRLKDLIGRKDKETVEEILVVKVISVYEAKQGTGKAMRNIRISDGKFSVNVTFFGKSAKLCDDISPGDVISLQYVNTNHWNIDPKVQPPNLTFKDLKEPHTQMNKLVGDSIPDDMYFETGSIVEGTVIDVMDFREYQSCRGKKDKCRSKIVPGALKCRCGETIKPEETYSDYIVSLVLWCEEGSKTVKCFRRSLEMLEDKTKEGIELISHLEDKKIRILVSDSNGEDLIADNINYSKASSTFE